MMLELPTDGNEVKENWKVMEKEPVSIVVETLEQIKDHEGESYTTERINVSEERVRVFLEATGDINPIHFNKERVTESVYSKKADGRIFVPGLFTQSLWTNEKGIYSALQINEPNEIILEEMGQTKFTRAVFADSDIVYKFTIKEVIPTMVGIRTAIKVMWGIEAQTQIGERMKECMTTEATLIYISLEDQG